MKGAEWSVEPSRMLAELKRTLRAEGIRYADVAIELGVSLKTVKRYMQGKGVTLDTLSRLCALAGISLRELAHLAAVDQGHIAPTPAQEDRLSENVFHALVFSILCKGWRPDEIARDFHIPPTEMSAILTQLEKYGLISVLGKNRVKPLVNARRKVHTARFRRLMAEGWRQAVSGADLDSPDTSWELSLGRLSDASSALLSVRFRELANEVQELSARDRRIGAGQARWRVLALVLRDSDQRYQGKA